MSKDYVDGQAFGPEERGGGRGRDGYSEVQQTDHGRPAVRALVRSGVMLARGLSWGDLGAMVVNRAVLPSVLLLFFSKRERFGRRR